MLSVTYKKWGGVRLTHAYFADSEEIQNIRQRVNGDVIFLHGIMPSEQVDGFLLTEQKTLIKELDKTDEELFNELPSKHLKQYIKRNYKDDVCCKCYSSNEILQNKEILSTCKMLYEKMFSDKGMSEKFNAKLAKVYCKRNALIIFMAYIEGVPIGFAAFLIGENARWWLSAFDFRNDKYDAQVLSRTHKRVIWDAIMQCRSQGCKEFDFGGVNSFEEPNGIAKFKLEFEKENKVSYNNYLVPRTLLGKIAIKMLMRKGR